KWDGRSLCLLITHVLLRFSDCLDSLTVPILRPVRFSDYLDFSTVVGETTQSKNRHGRKIETVGETTWSEKRLTIIIYN
uniref:Uncharacterized protein n=1 Tax=Romanomermis culicivorax TaxID=13658 RepID=A0A915HHT4_ROMCU